MKHRIRERLQLLLFRFARLISRLSGKLADRLAPPVSYSGQDSRTSSIAHKDAECFEVQPGAVLEVYWKIVPKVGRGAAIVLRIRDTEVLRMDCFGPEDGHFHVHTSKFRETMLDRIWFREQTVDEQIERSLFELVHNAQYYIQRCTSASVRSFTIDSEHVRALLPKLRETMLEASRKVQTHVEAQA